MFRHVEKKFKSKSRLNFKGIHVATNEPSLHLMEDPMNVATNESNPFPIMEQVQHVV
jgi:hypothetical protein